MTHISNDPWAFDDYQRRVMQRLFSDQVSEEEQRANRVRRSALAMLFEGLHERDRVKVSMAASTLAETLPAATFDGGFDVVGDAGALS